MNTIYHFYSASSVRLIIKATICMLLAGFNAYAYSQDTTTKIEKHQEKYSQLIQEFDVSISRIHSSINNYINNKQSLPADQLLLVSNHLASVWAQISIVDDNFNALKDNIFFSSMITDTKYVSISKRMLEIKRAYFIKTIPLSIEFIDKTLRQAKDQETIRLLLKARDTYKSSIDFLNQLTINDQK